MKQKRNQAELKAALMAHYSQALDELLAKNEGLEDFGELEEAVSQLAEQTLPQTLSALQQSKDFSPEVSSVRRKAPK